MMLNKKYYNTLEETMEKSGDIEKEVVLTSFQDEFLYDIAQLYVKNEKEELAMELQIFKRFQKMLSNYIAHMISYQIGILSGISMAIKYMIQYAAKAREIEIKMTNLFDKEINKKILMYLYDHPSAQHKVIAQAINVKTNYLSQQMRELEKIGGVVRYGVDRRSFYELTLDGQAFVEKKKKSDSFTYVSNLMKEQEKNEKCFQLTLDLENIVDFRRQTGFGKKDFEKYSYNLRKGIIFGEKDFELAEGE